MRLWESCPEFILQMPLSKIFIVIGRQIDQSKTCGVKIRKMYGFAEMHRIVLILRSF